MIISSPIFYIMITGIITISTFSIADYYSSDFLLISTTFAEPIPDDNGVMMWIYPSIGHGVYNPLLLSAHGLDNYYKNYEKTGDTKSKEYFFNTANWLVNNAKDKEGGKYSVWEFDFTWPWYNQLTPPYYSGYAQAVGIVVLTHAYNLTNNIMYLNEANKAFQALLFDYDDGGVTTIEDNGDSMFIHELGKPGFPKTYILNGQTGALLHIWQFYELTNNPVSKSVFDKGINYLKHNLWKYDTGSWSRYDLKPIGQIENLASMDYQKIHVDHLNRLYNITGEPILKEYADKFNNYIGRLN